MEQIQNDTVYTSQQVANLMQLSVKTVRQYLQRIGIKPVGNRYRITGNEVKELIVKMRGTNGAV